MRLIDADELKHVLCDECEFHTTLCREKAECDTVYAIDAQPTVIGAVGWICPVCGRGLSPYTAVCPCRNGKGWEITCD